MRKSKKIMASYGYAYLPEFYYDEEFWVRTRDGIRIDCVVEDEDMLDSDTMELSIFANASDRDVSEFQLKILIEMWFENQCDMCGVDYSVDVTRVNKHLNYDIDDYDGFFVKVEISNNETDDSYFSASHKIGHGRKVLSAIDLGKKQRFVDAYMNAYGVTKSDAFQIFRDCMNRGDESYIDEIIRVFGGNAKTSFYDD